MMPTRSVGFMKGSSNGGADGLGGRAAAMGRCGAGQPVPEIGPAVEAVAVAVHQIAHLVDGEALGLEDLVEGASRPQVAVDLAQGPKGQGRVGPPQGVGTRCGRQVRGPVGEANRRVVGVGGPIDGGLHGVPGLDHRFGASAHPEGSAEAVLHEAQMDQVLGGRVDLAAGACRGRIPDHLQLAGEEFRAHPETHGRQRPERQRNDPQQQVTLKAGRTATMVVAVGFLEIGVDRLDWSHDVGSAR